MVLILLVLLWWGHAAAVGPTCDQAPNLVCDAGDTLTGHLVLSADANEGLSGGGLTDCDNATTSKLLWDTTTNKFSCGTDQAGGGGMTSFLFEDDTPATPGTITDGNTFSFFGGTGIDVTTPIADTLAFTVVPAEIALADLGGTLPDAKLAASYSGVGACPTDQYAHTLTRAVAPTCSQVTFTQLGGTASAAQVPLATAAAALAANGANCTAGSYPLGVDSSGAVEGCTVAGGGGSGTVTSVDCQAGLTCTPDPIVGAGTIAPDEVALEALLDLPDLQGAVTDAQVPNTITLDTHALLAGRAGGQTLIGGTAATDPLTLKANTTDTTQILLTGANTVDITALTNTTTTGQFTPRTVVANNPGTTRAINFASTWTSNSASPTAVATLRDARTVTTAAGTSNVNDIIVDGASIYNIGDPGFFNSWTMFLGRPTFNFNVVDGGDTWIPEIFKAAPILNAANVDATATLPYLNVYQSTPTIKATGAAASLDMDVTGYTSNPNLTTTAVGGSATIGTMTHFKALTPALSGSGTEAITTEIGLDVAPFPNATTKIGIRNPNPTVYTPSAVQPIAAAGTAVLCNATTVEVSNTTGAMITLTATPMIADGQNGQLCTILATGADAIELSDQGTVASSNLRLSANTIQLGQRDSIVLLYSSAVGDWIQVGQTNVL